MRFIASGKYLPGSPIPSEELDQHLGLETGTIFKTSGVAQRHFANGESVTSMGAKALLQALDAAGLRFQDLDLVIWAGATMQQLIPCNAILLQRELGELESGVAAVDVNATCVSFLYALDWASLALAAKRYRRIAIVSAEIASLGLNWEHLESASLFGDGAVAFVVEASRDEQSTFIASHFETYARESESCRLFGGASALSVFEYAAHKDHLYRFEMQGPKVFKASAQKLPVALQRTLDKAGWSLADVDMVLPHQASASAMTLLKRRLGIDDEKCMSILESHGNCIAASMPLALHEAIALQRVQRGDRCLFLGTGAGLVLAFVAFRF